MAYDKDHFDKVRQFLGRRDEELAELGRPPLTGFEQELELGRMAADPPDWVLNHPDIIEKLAQPGRVALTGGIASGKSAVAEIFLGLGAAHIDLDLLARQAAEPGRPGFEAVVGLLGPEVVGSDGSLDRPKISGLVFSDPELKAGLEKILHPLIWELMGRELAALADRPVLLISVPLLFETGLESFFKTIVLVFVGLETQIKRLMRRQPGLDWNGARRLIDNQWPAPPKVMGSTYIINNCGSAEETRRQVEPIWRLIAGEAASSVL